MYTCHHPILWTLGTCCIACTQCIMTPLTLFCMLISAPLSNSTFTHSTFPATEALISAVQPFCNNKCKPVRPCQVQYNDTLLIVHKVNSTQGPTPHTVQQHILQTLAKSPQRGSYSAPSYIMISYTSHNLSYLLTPPHTTSLISLLI